MSAFSFDTWVCVHFRVWTLWTQPGVFSFDARKRQMEFFPWIPRSRKWSFLLCLLFRYPEVAKGVFSRQCVSCEYRIPYLVKTEIRVSCQSWDLCLLSRPKTMSFVKIEIHVSCRSWDPCILSRLRCVPCVSCQGYRRFVACRVFCFDTWVSLIFRYPGVANWVFSFYTRMSWRLCSPVHIRLLCSFFSSHSAVFFSFYTRVSRILSSTLISWSSKCNLVFAFETRESGLCVSWSGVAKGVFAFEIRESQMQSCLGFRDPGVAKGVFTFDTLEEQIGCSPFILGSAFSFDIQLRQRESSPDSVYLVQSPESVHLWLGQGPWQCVACRVFSGQCVASG